MKPVSEWKKHELRKQLSELADACPLHQANPEDCPLFPLRQMKPAKRLRWFNALSEDDLAYLATYHHVCFATNLESQLTEPRA